MTWTVGTYPFCFIRRAHSRRSSIRTSSDSASARLPSNVLDGLLHRAVAELVDGKLGNLVAQLGRMVIRPRPLDCHLLLAEKLLVLGRVEHRQNVAVVDHRPFGNHAEQDR